MAGWNPTAFTTEITGDPNVSKSADSQNATGRRRLGRGLGSLITAPVRIDIPGRSTGAEPVVEPKTIENSPASRQLQDRDGESASQVRMLPIETIQPNPSQPRQRFDEQSLTTLAESIRTAGLMQPVVVRPIPDKVGGERYELIAGERRWRASSLIGLERIPAVVREVDDRQAAEWSLIENIQREDLNPIERARAFRRLIDDFSLTQQQVAERIGIDRSNVANHLRLLELDDTTRELVVRGLLSLGQARALLAITNLQLRQALASKTVREGWTVRTVEQRVKQALGGGGIVPADGVPTSRATAASSGAGRNAHIQDLEKRLGEHLGTKVDIQPGRSKGAGKLVISFFDNKQFEGLLERMRFEMD